ncbi:hypothetical protein HR45_10545 [Shewanella mangrovi]|uniref:Uncharacterized protein n=1 Tax=Shewanella mangrovi TaxID=1515746 RepID=A0A094JE03_9GAMM|nr:hypothetical protein HR45_10545 [Shewanella mangrovi]
MASPYQAALGKIIAARLQPEVAKVVELLAPHQSQRAMLVPRPLETRRRPTAQNATALLVCHFRKSL